jgi:predicted ArsR family transcriptional regulator
MSENILNADTSFFSVFKELIDNGTVAELGVYSWTTYTVIKSYANYNSGESFPSVETIAIKSGISEIQVKRSLKQLENRGLLRKERIGRNNIYRLNELISLKDKDNQTIAKATFDYIPSQVKDTLAELRDVLLSGDLKGTKSIHIEHLQLNIVNNTANDNATVNNNYNLQDQEGYQAFLAAKKKITNG